MTGSWGEKPYKIGNALGKDSERSEESISLFFLGSLSFCNRKMRKLFSQKDFLKNISPPLGVIRFKNHYTTKIPPPLGVIRFKNHYTTKIPPPLGVIYKHHPSAGSLLASDSFPAAEKWKESR